MKMHLGSCLSQSNSATFTRLLGKTSWLLRVPLVPAVSSVIAVSPNWNNHAEQMLRPAVITLKVGGCNKNLLGALVHSILASLMVSCHRQGKRFLDLARHFWRSNAPQAIPLETLPASP